MDIDVLQITNDKLIAALVLQPFIALSHADTSMMKNVFFLRRKKYRASFFFYINTKQTNRHLIPTLYEFACYASNAYKSPFGHYYLRLFVCSAINLRASIRASS